MDYLKLSKKQTGLFFIGAYLLAIMIGLLTFILLEPFINNVIIVTLIANIVMTVVIFIFSLVTKNSSMYDPYWSVIPPVIIIAWLIHGHLSFTISRLLVLVGVLLWAIRLTYNWWKNWNGFKEQDWRYDLIKDKSKKLYLLPNFAGIHLMPTLVVYLQLINIYYILQSTSKINFLFILGFILILFASLIQHFADKQMYSFRQNRKNPDACIDQGIWRYSRHPNYLGELMIWVGVYLMYLGSGYPLNLNLIYPLAMIGLFLFVSIPLMEKKLISRECYQSYKKQVSVLLPYRKKTDK